MGPCLSGFSLTPGAPPALGNTLEIEKSNLAYETELNPERFAFQDNVSLVIADTDSIDAINSSITQPSQQANRSDVIELLGVDAVVNLTDTAGDMFLNPPQILQATVS